MTTTLIQSSIGDLNSAELALLLDILTSNFPRKDKATLEKAVKFATLLHSKQTRHSRNNISRAPYIEHPLRNTVRLVKWGVTDIDILVASLLHDTVEDSSKYFVRIFLDKEDIDECITRDLLLNYITHNFSKKASDIVSNVTNAIEMHTSKNKNQEYLSHVSEVIRKDPGTFLVKVSDFVDNAGGLHRSLSKSFIEKQVAKYQPVVYQFIEVFEERKSEFHKIMSNEGVGRLSDKLTVLEERPKDF